MNLGGKKNFTKKYIGKKINNGKPIICHSLQCYHCLLFLFLFTTQNKFSEQFGRMYSCWNPARPRAREPEVGLLEPELENKLFPLFPGNNLFSRSMKVVILQRNIYFTKLRRHNGYDLFIVILRNFFIFCKLQICKFIL